MELAHESKISRPMPKSSSTGSFRGPLESTDSGGEAGGRGGGELINLLESSQPPNSTANTYLSTADHHSDSFGRHVPPSGQLAQPPPLLSAQSSITSQAMTILPPSSTTTTTTSSSDIHEFDPLTSTHMTVPVCSDDSAGGEGGGGVGGEKEGARAGDGGGEGGGGYGAAEENISQATLPGIGTGQEGEVESGGGGEERKEQN